MPATDHENATTEPSLRPADLYRAAREGVIGQEEASRLVTWALGEQARKGTSPEDGKHFDTTTGRGLNPETVASYTGAMFMIAATNWLLGTKWEGLESPTILSLSLLYAMLVAGWGRRLRARGQTLRGALLTTVAVSQVPLITYTLQAIFHFWPGGHAPPPFGLFHMMAHPSWIVMDVATIALSLLALRRVRFSFLAAPLGYACLLLARDLPLWLAGYPRVDFTLYFWASIALGLLTVLLGASLSRRAGAEKTAGSVDLAFWPYLFGGFILWRGLSALTVFGTLHVSALLLFGLAMMLVGLRARRKTFIVFGALGLDQALLYLAHVSFADSFFFPFAMMAGGAYLLAGAFRGGRVEEWLKGEFM